MVRPNYRDAIFQAVSDISRSPSLNELNESAMKQTVVMRVLDAAGWSAFNLSEIEPEYQIGSSRVDYALKSAASPRAQASAPPKVFVEVKSLQENLDSERLRRRLMGHCGREGVELGVLTNGPRWLLFLASGDNVQQENRISEIDIQQDPETAAEELNKYLAKDKVSNGQAVRSAERSLRDKNRDEDMRGAIIAGWQQVVKGIDEGLVELVATAAESKAGVRPENRLIRRVLVENRTELLASAVESDVPMSGGGGRTRPASFTFEGETRSVRSWPDLLLAVCSLMRERHPDDFVRVLDIGGRKNAYFSTNEEVVNQPRQIGDTGIYASCQGSGNIITRRAERVLEQFGYPSGSLVIETR